MLVARAAPRLDLPQSPLAKSRDGAAPAAGAARGPGVPVLIGVTPRAGRAA